METINHTTTGDDKLLFRFDNPFLIAFYFFPPLLFSNAIRTTTQCFTKYSRGVPITNSGTLRVL